MPRGTANTAERRLSSDCGPATPWWVWGVPHAARARAAQRQTERKHSRLRGAGEDRAASATRSARERASPISIDLFKTHSVSSLSRMYQALRARAVRIRGRSRSGSVLTGLIQPDRIPFNISAIQAQIQPFSRLQRLTLIAKRHGTLYFSPPVCPNSLPCT